MFEYLATIFTKPFFGFALLVRLFVNDHSDANSPTIESLKLVQLHDSVFVAATIRNGVTPEIAELLKSGVVITTACTFSSGSFKKEWVRKVQFNPVSRFGCEQHPDGSCMQRFSEDSLTMFFSRVTFYLADKKEVMKMKNSAAHLTLATSMMVDALSLGKKELWPGGVAVEFVVPGVAGEAR